MTSEQLQKFKSPGELIDLEDYEYQRLVGISKRFFEKKQLTKEEEVDLLALMRNGIVITAKQKAYDKYKLKLKKDENKTRTT